MPGREVSRICADLDIEVAAFRDRSLAGADYPYVFLDATYCKPRIDHRVVPQAVVVAVGVSATGRREVLGVDVGDSEDGAFWTSFLRSLKARGLGRSSRPRELGCRGLTGRCSSFLSRRAGSLTE
jgi:transposase-like protein